MSYLNNLLKDRVLMSTPQERSIRLEKLQKLREMEINPYLPVLKSTLILRISSKTLRSLKVRMR
jgi:hypothetical protein